MERLFALITPEDGRLLLRLMAELPGIAARIGAQVSINAQARIIDVLASTGEDVSVLRFVNACHQRIKTPVKSIPDAERLLPLSSASPFVLLGWQGFVELLPYSVTSAVAFSVLLEHWQKRPQFAGWRSRVLHAFDEDNRWVLPDGVGFIEPLRQAQADNTPPESIALPTVECRAQLLDVPQCPQAHTELYRWATRGLR